MKERERKSCTMTILRRRQHQTWNKRENEKLKKGARGERERRERENAVIAYIYFSVSKSERQIE